MNRISKTELEKNVREVSELKKKNKLLSETVQEYKTKTFIAAVEEMGEQLKLE